MKIVNQIIFEGRNIYSHRKCIRLDLDSVSYTHLDVYKRQILICYLVACPIAVPIATPAP